MNALPMFRRLVAGAILCGLANAPLFAKPPKKPDPSPMPTPALAAAGAPASFVHWLLLQNGGPDAVSLPLADVIQAATGKRVLPIDPGNPADAAVIARIGGVMDRILPGMNKPDSPAHAVGRLEEVAAFFEDALGAFNATATVGSGFPAVRLGDPTSGKSYYLGVTLYPTGGRDAAVRALRLDPVAAAGRMPEDGACLLVGIEYNGKAGKEIAFLNWELLDLAKLPVHMATVFDASQGEAHPPGAVLNDGRKGRD